MCAANNSCRMLRLGQLLDDAREGDLLLTSESPQTAVSDPLVEAEVSLLSHPSQMQVW